MKKNIPFPLAIFVILLVSAAVIVVAFLSCPEGKKILFQNESGETGLDIVSTTTRIETDYDEGTSTENWQTYRNEEYGFEINYPKDIVVQDDGYIDYLNGVRISFCGGEYAEFCGIKGTDSHSEIYLFKFEKDGVEKELYSFVFEDGKLPKDSWPFGRDPNNMNCKIISITVNEETGKAWDCGASLFAFWKREENNSFYNMNIYSLNEFPKLKDTFDQMLSTFKFVEPVKTCVDNCGNGIYEEVVCLAIGCPCAETPENCPQDCEVKTKLRTVQLEIKDFTTNKQTYTSNEELRASLTVLSSGEVEDVLIKLTGIKPYDYAYINSSQTVDLISGENKIIFTEITPHCTSGCGGVYPGPYNLSVEIFVEENLVTSSTISINLTNN